MDQMPGPPPDIHERKITIIEFNDRMFRTHAINRSPIYFGKTASIALTHRTAPMECFTPDAMNIVHSLRHSQGLPVRRRLQPPN